MHTTHTQSGFSLIELLVALTIFSVVVTMATGTLLVLINANLKAQNVQAVINNVTFALDSMTRELRTGYNYDCDTTRHTSVDSDSATQDCTNGVYISLMESGGSLTSGKSSNRIAYAYDAGSQTIIRRLANDTWLPLTSPNVQITNFKITVTGSSPADSVQPTVTVFIEGKAGGLGDSTDSTFSMQTTVTQRLLDL